METAITKQDKYVAMFGYHRAMLQVAKGVKNWINGYMAAAGLKIGIKNVESRYFLKFRGENEGRHVSIFEWYKNKKFGTLGMFVIDKRN